jgi:hypothetical protein
MMTDQELAEELKGESLYGRRRALSNHGNATVNEVCERGGGREAPIESLFVESAPNYHFDEHLTEAPENLLHTENRKNFIACILLRLVFRFL